MPTAKCLASPDIQASLLRKAMGEIGDDECAGDEKKRRREQPKKKSSRTDVRRHTDPASADNGSDVEEHQVAQTKLPAKRRFGSGHGVRFRRGRIKSKTSLAIISLPRPLG